MGLLGFFDPATHWGLEPHGEDLGQTLGVWGLGTGPYLVLPLLGPSNVRDSVGLAGDYAIPPSFRNHFALITVDTVNLRAINRQAFANAQEAALDFYAFVRNAYLSRRSALTQDRTVLEGSIYETEATSDEDLYDDSLYDDSLYDDSLYDEDTSASDGDDDTQAE